MAISLFISPPNWDLPMELHIPRLFFLTKIYIKAIYIYIYAPWALGSLCSFHTFEGCCILLAKGGCKNLGGSTDIHWDIHSFSVSFYKIPLAKMTTLGMLRWGNCTNRYFHTQVSCLQPKAHVKEIRSQTEKFLPWPLCPLLWDLDMY